MKLAVLSACLILALFSATARTSADPLESLIDTSAQRLMLARQVALAKWDSGAAVEDASREEQVVESAVRAGEAKGLDKALVSGFFKAQIEANKIVQYSLLADWQRNGGAPKHSPINLVTNIRPELDRMQVELVMELSEISATRNSRTCRASIAKSVGQYTSTHSHDFRGVYAIALDRALATLCPQ
jgi:chorismate mutase